jgi:hypothetical protein
MVTMRRAVFQGVGVAMLGTIKAVSRSDEFQIGGCGSAAPLVGSIWILARLPDQDARKYLADAELHFIDRIRIDEVAVTVHRRMPEIVDARIVGLVDRRIRLRPLQRAQGIRERRFGGDLVGGRQLAGGTQRQCCEVQMLPFRRVPIGGDGRIVGNRNVVGHPRTQIRDPVVHRVIGQGIRRR